VLTASPLGVTTRGDQMQDDDVREEDCALCAQWPAGLRPMLRVAIDEVPLAKPVCDRCEEAFWVNVVRLQDQCRADINW
jgi:hypothetical protein